MKKSTKCGSCKYIIKGPYNAFLCDKLDIKMNGDCYLARTCKFFKRIPFKENKKYKFI